MLRVTSIVAFVLVSASAAWGQGQVVSYYGADDSPLVIIPSVPTGGFVLTDLVVAATDTGDLTLRIDPDTVMLRVSQSASAGQCLSHHFNSGIYFDEGSTVTAYYTGSSDWGRITVSGYIPTLSGAVPAISATGLGVMLLLIVAVGGFVFSRMKRAA